MFDSIVLGSKDRTHDMIKILCKQKLGLKICHINAQSLKNKIDEFRYIFEQSDIDIICVSETWFNNSIMDSIVGLNNYKIYRCDRKTPCGGVAIYVKNSITSKLCTKLLDTTTDSDRLLHNKIEFLFIEVYSGTQTILVGSVYRPNRNIDTSHFMNFLKQLTICYNDTIICGDFNSNLLRESHLIDDMKSIGMELTNTSLPTHFTSSSNTLLDIFFVCNKHKVLLYDQLSAPCFSKHDLIFMTYDLRISHTNPKTTYFDFKNIDPNNVMLELSNIDWDLIYFFPSVDNQLNFLEHNLVSIFEKTVPIKMIKQCNPKKPWFNMEIKLAIANRDLSYKRWKIFKIDELHTEYRKARTRVNKMIKNAKSAYYSNRFNTATCSRKKWKTIREIGIGKVTSRIALDADINKINKSFTKLPNVSFSTNFYENLQGLNSSNYFNFECINQEDAMNSIFGIKSNAMGFDKIHPKFLKLVIPVILPHITHIFNTIIIKSTYPQSWKYAKIIPIPKSNNEYRPIAILPFLSKAFERLIHKQISKYVYGNNLLTKKQSGFRPGHSCITALTDVSEDIRKHIDNSDVSFLVLLDHSKAFDMVDHRILCTKLEKIFNFSNSSTKLISSYLSGRRQSVFVNDLISNMLPISKGVPQGSILGPLLFSLYVNDLTINIIHCKTHIYADDVQLYISDNVSNINECIEHLNEDLTNVYKWACLNGLCINPTKSKCIILTKKHCKLPYQPDIKIDNQIIEIVSQAKNLGIIFNNTLTWSNHINHATGKTFSMLRNLWITHLFTPLNIRILLAKTYLIPTLLYGCELFASCDSASFRKLISTFNAILRYVYNLRKYDHISVYSKKLYGVSLNDLLKIRVLSLLHKTIYTKTPSYLHDKLVFARSSRKKDIIPLRFKSLMSEWQFFINAIRLWNSLPSSFQFICNQSAFKKKIFEFFC